MVYQGSLIGAAIIDVYFHGLVNEGDLFAVGRPKEIITETSAIGRKLFFRCHLARFPQGELVFAGTVRPVGDVFAIGGPGGETVGNTGSLGQICYRSGLGGNSVGGPARVWE